MRQDLRRASGALALGGAVYMLARHQVERRRKNGIAPVNEPVNEPVDEPLSPEVVLVSPPLEAERFRAALPEAPAPPPVSRDHASERRPEVVLVSPPLEAERFRAALPEPPAQAPVSRKRASARRLARVGALCLVALLGYLAATRWPHPPGPRLLTAVAEAPAAPRQTVTASSPATTSTPPITATTEHQAPTVVVAPPKPRPARAAVGGSAFVPARSWVWARADRVTAYEVDFYRNGARVFHALVHQPQVVMPKTFRFQPGRYRWTVSAAAPTRSTTRLVDSTFVLSAAAASAANAP
jgi:hypothetical protein